MIKKKIQAHTQSLELSPKSLDFEATSIYYVSKVPRAASIFVYRGREHACSYPLPALLWMQRESGLSMLPSTEHCSRAEEFTLCQKKTLRFCIMNCLETKPSPPQFLFAAVPNRVIVHGRGQGEQPGDNNDFQTISETHLLTLLWLMSPAVVMHHSLQHLTRNIKIMKEQ